MLNTIATIEVTNTDFINNISENHGGAIRNWENDDLYVENCTFDGNSGSEGGAILGTRSPLLVKKSKFIGNYSIVYAGAITNYDNTAVIENCVFIDNSCEGDGGAIVNDDTTTSITNCTFHANSALDEGGGIYDKHGSNVTVKNCILTGNTASNGPQIYNTSSTTTVTYSNVEGGWTGTGNIDLDPSFVNAPNDLRLELGSPCIDSGTSDGAPTEDILGNPRPLGSGFDMGAYEADFPPFCYTKIYCLDSVDEDDPISCPIYYNATECSGALSLGAGNTCSGASVVDNGDGTGSYSAPAQGEAFGPGACMAEIEIASDGVSDSSTIIINEVNTVPFFTSAAPTSATLDVPFAYAPTFDDSDLPDFSPGDPGYVNCVGISDNTCDWLSFSGCDASGTPGAADVPGSCYYDITVEDGFGAQAVQNVQLDLQETNLPPYWVTFPTDITADMSNCDALHILVDPSAGSIDLTVAECEFPIQYAAYNGSAADDNLPNSAAGDPGHLECGPANNTCSFPVLIEGSGAGAVNCNILFLYFTVPEVCSVDVVVTDGEGLSVSHTTRIELY